MMKQVKILLCVAMLMQSVAWAEGVETPGAFATGCSFAAATPSA